MLLITTFVELRVVAGRRLTPAGRPHADSGRPMLIHTCHAMPMLRCAMALRSRFQNGMVMAWHWHGMACVNQTRPHCVNQMGRTQSKPLATRHGRGTAWYVWISLFSGECCVLSGRGHCNELIPRPEKSYRLLCVVVCDPETSWIRRPWPAVGSSAIRKR
jgi:hypothetical protein